MHVADFRTGETRGARHEMSRSDSAANDSVEREGNPRKRRTGAMVVSRKVKKGFVVFCEIGRTRRVNEVNTVSMCSLTLLRRNVRISRLILEKKYVLLW